MKWPPKQAVQLLEPRVGAEIGLSGTRFAVLPSGGNTLLFYDHTSNRQSDDAADGLLSSAFSSDGHALGAFR